MTQKALCMSETSPHPRLQQVDRCTAAILFLGTPHRGSDLADCATLLTRFLKASGQRVNTDIVQICTRGSEVLDDVENAFAEWLRKKTPQISVVCFYEELELLTIGRVSQMFELCKHLIVLTELLGRHERVCHYQWMSFFGNTCKSHCMSHKYLCFRILTPLRI